MAKIGILLGIVCLVIIDCSGLFGRFTIGRSGLIGRGTEVVAAQKPLALSSKNAAQFASQAKVLSVATEEIGVRELTGKNDGLRVEQYLAYTGLGKGNPWCAAFVSWVYNKSGYSKPRTAWSPALFPAQRITAKPQPADVLGIYFPTLKRIAHCGIVERCIGDWVVSIEGNTNVSGSREGDGVYRKWRHQKTIHTYARWLDKIK
ncbi:peptidoglycan-binding protein [Pedobacter aquatilis]|uniref:peptidoglycan-binding protein n=1 Tax=Pedobacter aquatilis TaxID=351343 RepID=UPI00292FFC4C|nr:peptidoglycan-binding protein [Pedobacter aquatilis]